MIYATQVIVSATATTYPWFSLSTNARAIRGQIGNISHTKVRKAGGGDARTAFQVTLDDMPSPQSIFSFATVPFGVVTEHTTRTMQGRFGRFVVEAISGNSSSYTLSVLQPGK